MTADSDLSGLPQVCLDTPVLRALTHAQPQLKDRRGLAQLALHEAGLWDREILTLPTAFIALEYLGLNLPKFSRPSGIAFDPDQRIEERVTSSLRAAREFYSAHSELTTARIDNLIAREEKYVLDDFHAKHIFGTICQFVRNPIFLRYVIEALALDYCLGMSDFGDPPPNWKLPHAAFASLAPKRQVLIVAEHQLLRMGLQERRNGRPVSPARRLDSTAALILRAELAIDHNGTSKSLKEAFALGVKDNFGDVDYLDFAVLGWNDRPVTSFTFDSPAEVGARALVLSQLYSAFYETMERSGLDSSELPQIAHGEIRCLQGKNEVAIIDVQSIRQSANFSTIR